MIGPSGVALADVSLGATLERLVIYPRQVHRNQLARELLECGAVPKNHCGGISVSVSEADKLERLEGFRLVWAPEAALAVSNRAAASAALARVKSGVDQIVREGVAYHRNALAGSIDPSTLDDHQVLNVAAMTIPSSPGLCLFDEQGLGKTVSCIYAFDLLVERNEIDFALIVAPKSMVSEWPHDIKKFMKDAYTVGVIAGTRSEKLRALASRNDVLVTNYETAVTMERQLSALLTTYAGRCLLIVDESFFAKNLDARRTKAIRRLREYCRRAFVLCGTPAPNTPHDVVEQVNIADFGVAFDKVELPKDVETAHQVIGNILSERGLYVRNTKREALPLLPTKSFNRIYVPLSPKQLDLYRSALKGYVQDLNSCSAASFSKELTSFLARRMALLQICSNPKAVSDSYDEIPAKLLALDSLLRELVENRSEKVVLWSYFTKSIDEMQLRYSDYGVVRYDGKVPLVADRREAVRSFQEDNGTMIFIGNPAAAGAGLTLHRSRYAIYESLSNQAAHYLQSLDRIHRRGQERPVENIVLLCEDSIELQHYDALLRKESAAASLLGDPHHEQTSLTTLLREASDAWTLIAKQS